MCYLRQAPSFDMKEKEEGVISLEETSKTIMDGVLEYMYTGYVDVSAENVPELFAQADYFILTSLTSFYHTNTFPPQLCKSLLFGL